MDVRTGTVRGQRDGRGGRWRLGEGHRSPAGRRGPPARTAAPGADTQRGCRRRHGSHAPRAPRATAAGARGGGTSMRGRTPPPCRGDGGGAAAARPAPDGDVHAHRRSVGQGAEGIGASQRAGRCPGCSRVQGTRPCWRGRYGRLPAGGGGSRKGSEERPAARLAAGGVAGVVDRGCGHDWRTGVRRADGWESAGRQARAERRAPARRQGPGKSNTLSRRAWHVGVPRAGRAPFRPTPASLDASTLLDVGSARLPLSRPRIRKPTRRPAPQPRHAPALWPPPVAPSLPVG